MKYRDIGGKGPSRASDKKTEKLAKEWRPKSLHTAAIEKKYDFMQTKMFRGRLSEEEKIAVIMGFDFAIDAVGKAANENRAIRERIEEWKTRRVMNENA